MAALGWLLNLGLAGTAKPPVVVEATQITLSGARFRRPRPRSVIECGVRAVGPAAAGQVSLIRDDSEVEELWLLGLLPDAWLVATREA